MTNGPELHNYRDFWPHYLREHAKAETRCWHVIGTGAAVALLVAAILTFSASLFIAAVIAGYAPAWLSHFLVEKNQPATWRHPLWSLISDFRMTAYWLTGKLAWELKKAGVQPTR